MKKQKKQFDEINSDENKHKFDWLKNSIGWKTQNSAEFDEINSDENQFDEIIVRK